MSKKLISVMLALVMVLSVFSVSAFAASINVEYETYDEEAGETEVAYTQTWYLDTTNEADANGKFTVDVYLETNYAVGAISFNVTADGATLEGVAVNDAILDEDGYNGDVQVNLAKGNVYIIPQAAYEAAEGLDLTTATAIATLTYSLDEGVSTATVTLSNDAKTIDNAGKLIAVRLGDDILASDTMYYGQRVLNADGEDVALGDVISEVTLGEEVVAADPVLSGVDTGYVDAARNYVYGVPAGANPSDYFTVENGSFEMVANAGGYTNGTGATLVVKDTDGNEFATYTLVIFGDVDGNGTITAADSTVVKMAALGGAIEGGTVFEFAADVDGNGTITAADSTVVKMAALGGGITVNPFAA